jgi:glycosyltransferase involved in cell wall biosynthesis
MQTPLLTLLVPTRNRAGTLGSTLASCLAGDDDRLRVIVSDNQSEDDTRDVVAAIDDPRLTYLRTDRRLSMSGNFQYLLDHAPDGYLMHLGDDDGIMAGGLAVARALIEETSAEAVISAHAIYHWPESPLAGHRNLLIMRDKPGYDVLDSKRMAQRVIGFRESYTMLPGTYSGFVRKEVIERVSRDGSYYRSITPDIFSSFANAGVTDRYVYSRRSFALSGISKRSNGGAQLNTSGDTSEAQRFKRENDLPIHPLISMYDGCLEIIVAEAFLQARDHARGLHDIHFDPQRLFRVALRNAVEGRYPGTRAAVAETARLMGQDYDPPSERTKAMAVDHWLAQNRARVQRLVRGYRRVDCSRHGVVDILGATRLGGQLLGL